MSNDQKAAAEWAAEVLADPRTVVLDTETTGLRGYICELSILDPTGTFLFDRILNPEAVVEAGARDVHGITDEEIAGAPTFAYAWPAIKQSLTGRRVIVYNADFDNAVFRRELHRREIDAPAIVTGWECAMRRYAQWRGEWDDYHGHYRWQRLNGGHRAGEDCKAVYDRLREMAAS